MAQSSFFTDTCVGVFLTGMFLFGGTVNAQENLHAIIPQPVSVQKSVGTYRLSPATKVWYNKAAAETALFLATLFRQATGYRLPLQATKSQNAGEGIYLLVDDRFEDSTRGAYSLQITTKAITAKAKDNTGLFYAVQSLRHLLPPAIENNSVQKNIRWEVPAMTIKDAPRYQWRGYMQDVSRTFYWVDVIKKYIDVLALFKMNTLHLHLTDDQGWRIEIKKYPELTSARTTIFDARHEQPAARSGYYTQADIRELVQYAAARHINIVPEIDVPGHCWPVILTHPELGVNKTTKPDYVFPFLDSWSYWGFQFTPNPLDPTKEAVYTFLDDVFTEVAALFPSAYIHFGGDEVVHRLWESEPHIKAFMKAKGMQKIEALQSYFVQRVSDIIIKKGKKPIGWNDILEDVEHLPKSTAIMSWLGAEAVVKAAKNKFYTIATPAGPLYFDIQQLSRDDGTMADLNYQGPNTIEAVYNYDPAKGLTSNDKQYILGIQANMWPAVPQEVKDINVQNFPRLLAVAEIGWVKPENKDLAYFLNKVQQHLPRLEVLKFDYFKPGGYIAGTWETGPADTVFKTVKWEVTQKVYTNGSVTAGFFYTGGPFLKVKNVKLWENEGLIAQDAHESVADKFRGIPYKKNMFLYYFKVNDFKKDSRYYLTADVAASGTGHSKGNITFNLSPYVPFRHTEPHR